MQREWTDVVVLAVLVDERADMTMIGGSDATREGAVRARQRANQQTAIFRLVLVTCANGHYGLELSPCYDSPGSPSSCQLIFWPSRYCTKEVSGRAPSLECGGTNHDAEDFIELDPFGQHSSDAVPDPADTIRQNATRKRYLPTHSSNASVTQPGDSGNV